MRDGGPWGAPPAPDRNAPPGDSSGETIRLASKAGFAVYGARVLPTSRAFVYTDALLASNNSEAGSTRNYVLEGLRASLCGLSALSGI